MAARIRAGASGIALLALGLALSGCGGSQDAAVRDLAEEFYGAVADGDGAAACALLAPTTRSELEQSTGKECAVAILEEPPMLGGDGGDVQVFGVMAQVRRDGDTVFLTRMPDGWRVLAAGCAPRPTAPYDCACEGSLTCG